MAAVPSTGRADQVDRLAAPEADATRALYERYANQIFGYCLHQLGSREEAEDAVQSTFLNAFRGLKRGVVPEMEAAWLFKIAHNVCLSRRRSSWRRGRIESPADFELVEELAPAPSRRADELIGLQDVLETMPENQRRAILLREWQGLSYHEIGHEMGLSQSAVETLIFRARRSLASGLEQPPEPLKKRARARLAGDLGNLLAGIKSLLLGSAAAVKVAATVAVISATTVVAAAPVQSHRQHPAPPAAPASTSSDSAAAAGGTVLMQPLTLALQGGRAAVSPRHRVAGKGQLVLSAGAAFGLPAIADGTTPPSDAQASTGTSTEAQAPADQSSTQQQAPAQAPAQPTQPVGPAPSTPAASGNPSGTATTPVQSSGSDGAAAGPTTVSAPLSQTVTPGLSQTSGQSQDQSGPGSSGSSSSGSGSSGSGSTGTGSTGSGSTGSGSTGSGSTGSGSTGSGSSGGSASTGGSTQGQTTTPPPSTARSLPVPPIPVSAPVATTPVTTTPVTTSPPPSSSGSGSGSSQTTGIVIIGPVSQHVTPGLSTTSGSGTSGSTTGSSQTSTTPVTVTAPVTVTVKPKPVPVTTTNP